MSESKLVRLRPLPGGEFRDGLEAGRKDEILNIDFPDEGALAGLVGGVPVEVESVTGLYLGVLQDCRPDGVSIRVEHYLERAEIESIQETWG